MMKCPNCETELIDGGMLGEPAHAIDLQAHTPDCCIAALRAKRDKTLELLGVEVLFNEEASPRTEQLERALREASRVSATIRAEWNHTKRHNLLANATDFLAALAPPAKPDVETHRTHGVSAGRTLCGLDLHGLGDGPHDVTLQRDAVDCDACLKAAKPDAETKCEEDCGSCRGYGHFSKHGKPSLDKRDRKCLDCGGTGKVPDAETKEEP
jgi:hypothetical protein